MAAFLFGKIVRQKPFVGKPINLEEFNVHQLKFDTLVTPCLFSFRTDGLVGLSPHELTVLSTDKIENKIYSVSVRDVQNLRLPTIPGKESTRL